ncbi:DegT/DnrJ/EryC1/StrS family aminotransferase [Microlunatus soli]|uniref:dTDP-4-amino-4,6-dideoxygalactose transaminase n=1 Tax=Microlunatus soli TaxID=630515 RepID=A0A1H1YLU7_9ACTN|nr:DegT/DnrJ/EryC1/StrS family aminotransferase [Microlunatus soli]SDT22370.1 dTDP-4-amino-4,6-dideoxygalactose transaminase [Microlunatus soli]
MDEPVRTRPWTFGAALSVDAIGSVEREYVSRVLDKRRVFRYTRDGIHDSEAAALEDVYRKRLGVRHCLAVNGGTSALVCALVAAGIGPGDEVVIPSYTYIATASAVILAGAVPVIVDIDETLTIDPKALENSITKHTKAVIPVHMRGVPCQMDEISTIAARHGLIVIEDAAQANGGSYHGRPLGSFGHLGCFSFQQYKIVTAGEGGLVATNDDHLFERACVYHDGAFAMWDTGTGGEVETFPGQNYRISEISAAVALAQSQRLDDLLARLRRNKAHIIEALATVDGIELQPIPDPAGDVAYSLILFLPVNADIRAFSERLAWEGIPNGTVYNKGFPDRHIFTNWDYVLAKRGVSPTNNPWTSPYYHGNIDYPPDLCQTSLDLLGRAIQINLHQDMDSTDCADIVTAIRRTARRVSARPSTAPSPGTMP